MHVEVQGLPQPTAFSVCFYFTTRKPAYRVKLDSKSLCTHTSQPASSVQLNIVQLTPPRAEFFCETCITLYNQWPWAKMVLLIVLIKAV